MMSPSEKVVRLESEVEALKLRLDEQDRLLALLRAHEGGCSPADVCLLLSRRLLETLIKLRGLGEFYSTQLLVKTMSEALSDLDREAAQKRFRKARMRSYCKPKGQR